MNEEEISVETKEVVNGSSLLLTLLGFIFYIGSFSNIGYGLSKIFNYKNYGDNLSSLNVNAYVGGDAYNYIINGTYATTYCVIGVVSAIIGSTCFIVNAINKSRAN
ncbi:hypothetical protein [Aggregatibacter kilianii]|jgi:hypothetical protein|uniref:hypothetical protein n=1 Tax=Aggregatibacter kilianii TaxID=2025884 RepID=UPI000D65BCF0|nr:hypothetical protein [Aggregatibacter kilianii]DAX25247.1 MAG TPA: hypothetical protein [Bacteriophage sp.]